jgi:hypothetical protein
MVSISCRGRGWGIFERRGREGYAESAEEDKENTKSRCRKNSKIQLFRNPDGWFTFTVFFGFHFVFLFCVLCATFTPSAFKKM